jgi:hypothetical protein
MCQRHVDTFLSVRERTAYIGMIVINGTIVDSSSLCHVGHSRNGDIRFGNKRSASVSSEYDTCPFVGRRRVKVDCGC